MKILIYGTGPLANLYASRLHDAGYTISVFGEGERAEYLKKNGIRLHYSLTGDQTTTPVKILDEFPLEESFDAVFVICHSNMVIPALHTVAQIRKTRTIAVMANNPLGYDAWADIVGRERLIICHEGAGAIIKENHVECYITARLVQPTTFGELDGSATPRLHQIVDVFNRAGFPSAISRNMDAWHKIHCAWINPMVNAIYAASGDTKQLSKMPETINLMIDAVKEGFDVLKTLNIPTEPWLAGYWRWLPKKILFHIYRFLFSTRNFQVMLEPANATKDESRFLTLEFLELAKRSGVTPNAITELAKYNTL